MSNINLDRKYITTSEAAKRANLSKVYIRQRLREHQIDGFQLGREWFVYLDSLENFLATPRKSGPRGPRKKNNITAQDSNFDTQET